MAAWLLCRCCDGSLFAHQAGVRGGRCCLMESMCMSAILTVGTWIVDEVDMQFWKWKCLWSERWKTVDKTSVHSQRNSLGHSWIVSWREWTHNRNRRTVLLVVQAFRTNGQASCSHSLWTYERKKKPWKTRPSSRTWFSWKCWDMWRLFGCWRTEQHRDRQHGVFSPTGVEGGEEAADSLKVKPSIHRKQQVFQLREGWSTRGKPSLEVNLTE